MLQLAPLLKQSAPAKDGRVGRERVDLVEQGDLMDARILRTGDAHGGVDPPAAQGGAMGAVRNR